MRGTAERLVTLGPRDLEGSPHETATGTPNEFLHLPVAERLTACVADVIVAHHRARRP